MSYLSSGFGGLVLTAKADEKDLWRKSCAETGRSNDLIILEPGGSHSFNFLDYEATRSSGGVYTDNLVQVLKTVIRASEEKGGGKADDPFWENALDMLVFHVIDLCLAAYDTVSVETMYEIVMSAPKRTDDIARPSSDSAFWMAFNTAKARAEKAVNQWIDKNASQASHLVGNAQEFQKTMEAELPGARVMRHLNNFFMGHYRTISDKTRSVIELMFSGFLFRLMREPFYSLFCQKPSTVTPEDSLNGKVILLNFPTKIYGKVARDVQILFKYCWQRAMETRNILANDRPVFLYCDESQHFIHEHDADYQATCRSSRIATVYITQNLSQYYANMSGDRSEPKIKSFLGTLGTKIFHANADVDTNKYASELIGQGWMEDNSRTVTVSGELSVAAGQSFKLEQMVRPEDFAKLKMGGPKNNYVVEAYIHRQGRLSADGFNHQGITFRQSK